MTAFLSLPLTDSLARLTDAEQKSVKTTVFDLQVNPEAPGLPFHRLDRVKDKGFWSVRVSGDVRITTPRRRSVPQAARPHRARAKARGTHRRPIPSRYGPEARLALAQSPQTDGRRKPARGDRNGEQDRRWEALHRSLPARRVAGHCRRMGHRAAGDWRLRT